MYEDNIDVENREIFLSLSDSDSLDCQIAVDFYKNMSYLNKIADSPITVHMNISGGSCEYGLNIYHTIKMSKSRVKIIGHSGVYSIATVILQAADKRVLMPSAELLIHYPSITFENCVNTLQSRSESDILEKITSQILDIYVDRCSNSQFFEDDDKWNIRKFFIDKLNSRQEYYISPHEAITLGLADKICTSEDLW